MMQSEILDALLEDAIDVLEYSAWLDSLDPDHPAGRGPFEPVAVTLGVLASAGLEMSRG